MPFSYANKLMTKKEVTKLIDSVYRQSGHRETVTFLDKIKDAGFTYATRAGVSICIDNMHIPSKKEELDRQGAARSQRDRTAVCRRLDHQRRTLQQGHRHLGARDRTGGQTK